MCPKLLLDIDGILTDFHAAVLRTAVKAGFEVSVNDLWVWEMTAALRGAGAPSHVIKTCMDAMAAEGFNNKLEPDPEAIESLPKLREISDVLFVTAPNPGCPTWMNERVAWMRKHFNVEPNDILFSCQKSSISGDVFVDDNPANVLDWSKAHPGKLSVLWSAPYNRRTKVDRRIKSWSELLNLAKSLQTK